MFDWERWNTFCEIRNGYVIGENEMKFINVLTTAKSSTASVKSIILTSDMVHTKLINQLRVEKASKLVSVMKQTNNWM